MTGKGIVLEHVLERGLDMFRIDLPRHQRAGCEVGAHERLAHAADRSRFEHGADPLNDEIDGQPTGTGDFAHRIADKSGDAILKNREDTGVDFVGMADGGHGGHSSHTSEASTVTQRWGWRRRLSDQTRW